MLYYHGSKSKFKEFSEKGNGKHGPGFYFTPDKNEAFYFAKSLYGNGGNSNPTIYTVSLNFKKCFNTMDIDQCEEVMNYFGLKYKIPKMAGGLKEHYFHLNNQLKKNGISKNLNEILESLGYDSIEYDLMKHIIVFNSSQINIEELEEIET